VIAVWRSWNSGKQSPIEAIARSLGLFAGVPACAFEDPPGNTGGSGRSAFAQLDGPRPAAPRKGWVPARTAAGRRVLFHGSFDNLSEIAADLGLPAGRAAGSAADRAAVYGEAVARWGNDADLRIHGSYCAAIDLGEEGLRLSRSPWHPPPLHYVADGERALACSSLRGLVAGGVPRELDRTVLAEMLAGAQERGTRGWYKGTFTVLPGSAVIVRAGGVSLHRWYDPEALPQVRFRRDEDYVEAAAELLSRSVAAALRESRSPGISLSGGLDSGLAAAEVLRQLPAGRRLPSFTHCPHPDWNGVSPPGTFGNERAAVEAFAAMHPALDPQFLADPERGFDDAAMPLAAATGMFFRMIQIAAPFQGVWRAARDARVDLLLGADLGNVTLSCGARWAACEFLRTGEWEECAAALRTIRGDSRPMWRRFAAEAVLPNMPRALRRAARSLAHPGGIGTAEVMNILRPGLASHAPPAAAERFGSDPFELPRSQREAVTRLFHAEMMDAGEVIQGYEQIYGLRYRDLTAYRPLMELCFGMPTSQFMRGGVDRWLARRMAAGRMPESQRMNRLQGGHHVDWHERMTPRLPELRARLDRVAQHPWLGEWIDTDRLGALLDDWPDASSCDVAVQMPRLYSLPLAINAADFVDWIDGRND
jgi:asparagine synthase (glutamine-hydrolysing)